MPMLVNPLRIICDEPQENIENILRHPNFVLVLYRYIKKTKKKNDEITKHTKQKISSNQAKKADIRSLRSSI